MQNTQHAADNTTATSNNATIEMRPNRGGAVLATLIQPIFPITLVIAAAWMKVLDNPVVVFVLVCVVAWMIRQMARTWQTATTGEPVLKLHADSLEYPLWRFRTLPLHDIREVQWEERHHVLYLVLHLKEGVTQYTEGQREQGILRIPMRQYMLQNPDGFGAELQARMALQ